MEILIADGMSTDVTRDLVAQTALTRGEIPVIVVDNPGRIVPTGMNAALPRAKGDIIVRVDGHCEIAPDYVSCCVQHLLEDNVDGVGGPIDTIGNDLLSQSIAVAMSSIFGVGGSAFRTIKDKKMLVDTVAFPAYTRQAIEKAGPYDEELVRNQDDEYNYRLRSLNCKILLSPDIHSRYFSRSTIRSLWRQYFQYGYWKVRVMQKHPAQMSVRQFVPPLFVAVLSVGLVLFPFSALARSLWLLVIGLYLVANLAASLYEAARRGWQYLRWLPIIFATLHLSYGAGFLLGMIKFANRWQTPRL
jgi:succinoglycan biosynthesis protein ExoA